MRSWASRWPCYGEVISAHQAQRRRQSLRRRSEAVLFSPPPPSQRDFRQAELLSRERYTDLERTFARRAQLGIQRPKLRESIRHWYRRLTRRKPAERYQPR